MVEITRLGTLDWAVPYNARAVAKLIHGRCNPTEEELLLTRAPVRLYHDDGAGLYEADLTFRFSDHPVDGVYRWYYGEPFEELGFYCENGSFSGDPKHNKLNEGDLRLPPSIRYAFSRIAQATNATTYYHWCHERGDGDIATVLISIMGFTVVNGFVDDEGKFDPNVGLSFLAGIIAEAIDQPIPMAFKDGNMKIGDAVMVHGHDCDCGDITVPCRKAVRGIYLGTIDTGAEHHDIIRLCDGRIITGPIYPWVPEFRIHPDAISRWATMLNDDREIDLRPGN